MTTLLRKTGLIAFALIVLAGAALLTAGCSDSEETSTTTTIASTATTAAAGTATTLKTDSSQMERVIVGGSTKEEYEAALPELEKAAAAAPDDLTALQNLAIAQYNTGRLEEAATTYQKMLQLKDDAFTRNNYGNVLRDLKRLDEAKAEYEKAISMDPSQANTWVNLAAVLISLDDGAEALAVLDRGIATVTGDDKKRLERFKDQLTGQATTTT